MKIYLYRSISKCIDGDADLCQISSRKLKLTKSGELARNQAPFNKQCIINTDSLKLFKIKKPRLEIITVYIIDKNIFIEIVKNQYVL